MTSFLPGATGEKCTGIGCSPVFYLVQTDQKCTGISCNTPVYFYSDPGYEFCEKKDCSGLKINLYKII